MKMVVAWLESAITFYISSNHLFFIHSSGIFISHSVDRLVYWWTIIMAIFVIIKIDFYCFFFLFCRDHLITTAQPVPKHTSDHATVSNLLMNAHCRNIVHLQEWMFAVERCSIEIYHNFSSLTSTIYFSIASTACNFLY